MNIDLEATTGSLLAGSWKWFERIIEVITATMKPETKWEKRKTTSINKSEKRFVSLPENQMLLKGKPENRKRHQNRETEKPI